MTNTIVNFDTVLGHVRVELFDTAAPQTVTNFLNYVTSGRYNSTIVHRSAKLQDNVTPFVIQGGGFTLNQSTNTLGNVSLDPPVVNEFSATRSNVRGTIAMAKGESPDSATSQWFFNLGDNSGSLDNPSNSGGFTVFGQVLGNGMTVVDAIAALPRINAGSPFNELPLRQPLPNGATSIPLDYWVVVNRVDVLQNVAPVLAPIADRAVQPNQLLTFSTQVQDADSPHEKITYSLVNGAPSGASVHPDTGVFTWTPAANQSPGLYDISLRATDASGLAATQTFRVAVGNNGPAVTATINAVTPSPRTTPINQMSLNFSSAVSGFDLSDLQLTRNGGPNLLTASQTLTTADNQNWTLGNLTNLTRTPGNYQLTLTAAGGPITGGGNQLQVGTTSNFAVDGVFLGAISQSTATNLNPSAGELWYRFQASRTGYLTVDASFSGDASTVGLTLFDDTLTQSNNSSAGAGTRRIDQQVTQGATYYVRLSGSNTAVQLRITNLVTQGPGTLNVFGTPSNDTFSFAPDGTSFVIVVNGVTYTTNASENGIFNFDGQGGSDSANITGSPNGNRATLQPSGGSLNGTNFIVNMVGLANLSITGSNSNDRADVSDSAGNDQLAFATNGALLTGAGYSLQLAQFPVIMVSSKNGGTDSAAFIGTSGNDRFIARPDQAAMTSPQFFRSASGFSSVTVSAGSAQSAAFIYGSPSDESVTASLNQIVMLSNGRRIEANNFTTTRVVVIGGNDQLTINLPNNVATELTSDAQLAVWRSGATEATFSGFERVSAIASGGIHSAMLLGTTGQDALVARPGNTQLAGAGYRMSLEGVAQVHAFGAGGNDTAVLRGTTTTDQVVGAARSTQLLSGGSLIVANDFDRVSVASNKGQATAVLHAPADAPQGSLLTATANTANLEGPNFGIFLSNFARVVANAGTDQDEAAISTIDYVLERNGNWNLL